MPKYAKKRDTNESEMVYALRDAGALVYPISELFDLLVVFQGRLFALEVKRDYSATKRKDATAKSQAKLRDEWASRGVTIHVVTSVAEALAAIGAIKGDA